MTKYYEFTVTMTGDRLDLFLSKQLTNQTRSAIQNLIAKDCIEVNGHKSKAAHKVKEGEVIAVTIPPLPPSAPVPQNLPLTIIYEDADIIVVDKAPGISVHPGPGHPTHTIVNALLWHYPDLKSVGESSRPGIVHRLDKDTSGLMVIAKTTQALTFLQKQWKDRRVSKYYWALAHGVPDPASGTISSPIGRDPKNRKRMAISVDGKPAITHYHTEKILREFSFLKIVLETGRTHQIRVHMASIGHPLVGDTVYNKKSKREIQRQFLHAYFLRLAMPQSGTFQEFSSELPADLSPFYKHLVNR